jgi:hypothetical protein
MLIRFRKKFKLEIKEQKMFFKVIKKIFLLCLASTALAQENPTVKESDFAFMIEPYAGWSMFGRTSQPIQIQDQKTSDSSTFNGFQLGLTGLIVWKKTWFIGPDFGFIPALNYRYYTNGTQGNVPNLTDATNLKFGLIAGAKLFDSPWRAWVGYNFEDDLIFDINNNSTIQQTAISGTALKLGIGYLFLDHLCLNLEYSYISFHQRDNATTSESSITDQTTTLSNTSSHLLSVLVSLPFDIQTMPDPLTETSLGI